MKSNTDMTVYNRYTIGSAEYYVRHVISEVHWENRKASNVLRSGGNREADQATVFIPKARGVGVFLDHKTWLLLPNEDKANYWTLKTDDYIVKGVAEEEITLVFTITRLKEKYPDVLRITSVDFMDFGTPRLHHWQIGAK